MSASRWQRIEELFASALEQPPEQRAAYVAAAVDDPGVSGEVLSLLKAHEGRGRLDSIADQLHGLRPAAASVSLADLLDRLRAALGDRYRVERELGHGGMAIVLLAEDVKLNRKVALKVLQPDLALGIGPARFLQEIAIAAQLAHPHILPLHDSGEADGLLYYVMPYVEGESLRDRLRRERRLSVEEAIQIARQVADALSYAHSHDVIHRDIKPDNILLEAGHAVVSDFGIARAMTVAGGNELGETGFALGTPAYMSPEQAVAGRNVDGRSDLYSLGCVLYEALCGEPPFAGQGSVKEIIAAQVLETPEPLGAKRPDLPAAVAELVMSCLAKLPSDRPSSARALLDTLATIPVTPRGEALPALRAGPGPWLSRVGAMLVVVAVAGYLAGVWGRDAPAPASGRQETLAGDVKTLAVLPLISLGGDSAQEYFADGLSDELTTALAHLPGVRVASRSSAFAFKGRADVDVREKGRRLGVATIVEGTVRRSGDRVRVTAQLTSVADGLVLWSDGFDRGVKDIIAAQEEIAAAVARALRLSLGPARESKSTSPEAYDLYLRGRYFANRGTKEGLERSLDYYQRALHEDSAFAPIYAGIAATYLGLEGAYLSPTTAYPKVVHAAARAIALDDGLAEAHALLSYSALNRWDWAAAKREAERAVALNPSEPLAQGTLFFHRVTHGDRAGAVAALRQWLRLDPLSPVINQVVVAYLLVVGEADSALAVARRAEELAPGFLYIDSWLGHALVATGRFDEALAVFQRARQVLGRPTPGLALVYARLGRRTEAEAVLRQLEALANREPVLPEHLAQVHAVLGDVYAAFAWLERGVRAHSGAALGYPLHPDFAALRTDPRWQRLRERLNLDREVVGE